MVNIYLAYCTITINLSTRAYHLRYLKLIEKELTMSIEQNMNMQELREEEYTKVYGGAISSAFSKDFYVILPIGPIKPKKPEVND